jgi:hypothetical protein
MLIVISETSVAPAQRVSCKSHIPFLFKFYIRFTQPLIGVTRPLRKEPVPFEILGSQNPLAPPIPSHEVLAMLRRAIAHLRKEYITYIEGCEADANYKYFSQLHSLYLSSLLVSPPCEAPV